MWEVIGLALAGVLVWLKWYLSKRKTPRQELIDAITKRQDERRKAKAHSAERRSYVDHDLLNRVESLLRAKKRRGRAKRPDDQNE